MKSRLFLLTELVRRDLATRYAGSFGGAAWALLNPLLLCLIYSVVFGQFLRIAAPTGFPGNYTEFLLAGLLPWVGFQEAVVRGSSGITDQSHLIKKLPFPAELLVVANVLSALILQLAAVSLLAAWAGFSGRGSVRLLPLLAGIAFELLILIGPVFALAALQVFFRDLAQLLSPLLMIVFYLTPILYPAEAVPARYGPLLAINPVSHVASLFRAGLFGTALPATVPLAGTAAVFVVVAFLGHRFFRRSRGSFADLL